MLKKLQGLNQQGKILTAHLGEEGHLAEWDQRGGTITINADKIETKNFMAEARLKEAIMKRVVTIAVSLVLLGLVAYLLSVRFGTRDSQETYRGRSFEYSGVAMAVLSYYPSRHDDELPKSLEDPDLQEPLSWSYLELKEKVVFNTLYMGRKVGALTAQEPKDPFLIEKQVRPSGLVVLYDYSGEEQRLSPSELAAVNLTPEARAELADVLSEVD